MPQPEGTAPREGIRTQLRLPKVPPAIRPLAAADPGREPRSCGLSLAALALGALISATAAPAHAQTATTGQTLRPWTAPPASADPLSIASPRPLSFLTTAAKTEDLGPLPGVTEFANTLANHGIYLSLGYVEDLMANVSGGIQTGTMPTGELYFGSTLDLHKILGIPEASIHITFDERNGYNLNNIVGTQGVLQSNSGPTRTIRLSELYWQQGFLDNRIKFKVGRTNPTGDFATLPLSCEFAGVICAQPTSWYFSNDDEAYPVSTWGGDVNIKVTPHVYLRAGVYDDDLDQFASTEHGFGWGLTGSKGAFVPVQIGYSTSFSQARYPSHFNLGGYYDSAAYTPPGGMEQRGRSAIWVEGEQTVWRPDPATKQSFTLFAGGIVYRHGAPYWGQYFGGFQDRAPFGAVRPDDRINFIASYFANNAAYSPAHSGQWIFELNYGFHVVKGLVVKPVTQYIVHPNAIGLSTTKAPENAWVIGVQFDLDVASMLHLPSF